MQKVQLNLTIFLQELMKEMKMENNQNLKNLMEEELADVVVQAISMNVDPLLLAYINSEFANETNMEVIYSQLIANSPIIQMAILDALEDFRKEMLESMHSKIHAA